MMEYVSSEALIFLNTSSPNLTVSQKVFIDTT